MTSRIKEVMMKKIWRIPIFLLIIITLGFSIMVTVLVDTPKLPSTVPVIFGTDHLIDGYNVMYGEDLEARWTVRESRFQSDGRFLIDLQFDYLSEDPKTSKIHFSHDNTSTVEVDLEYVGSVILLAVRAAYEYEYYGDFLHEKLTDIIRVVANSTNSRLCFTTYSGRFRLPREKEGMTLYGIEVQTAWIRVFREKHDENLYYQWMQGNSNIWEGERLEVDKTHNNFSGGFLVYYPIPESVTSSIPLGFDYVEWIKENM